ncbi:Asp23/Gls24 family envelope stress response protein [Actinopolyspora erythraea]|uniref:Asp23/Gls24 family envelope stress response protein n=1 Tax=Actinopolyspora erythraea TaxID=414996 RepID=A0A099D4D0_9ACTN|nr:Asp23/Gls24 family envelope stress response protein [Actinopolyspora erythraea]ASU79478.1 Asp23/Gls24 family envelope stress response protein [Actinopolyspora erythraea]KGI80894.1 stress-like protein [Actinopolyspora erythraea]
MTQSGSTSARSTKSGSSQSEQSEAPDVTGIPESRSGGTPARLADDTSQGKTSISSSVVQKIAGIAAREISGVYSMGGGVSRAFGALRERIPGGSGSSNVSGVQVEVGERQTAIDLDIVVEYGAAIVDLARAVRRNVIHSVERMCGLEVTEVNISVNDIHLPSDDEEETQQNGTGSRVQ